MDFGFAEALLVFGALLTLAAALSGVSRATVLSTAVLSVAAGLLLALTGAVSIDPENETVFELIELALILTLFSDGMFVERELLAKHWGPPARAIVIAMPITLLLLALAAKGLFSELNWAEAFLLAAVLSPTDPVVTSSIVTSRQVPSVVRHTLNLESGLNDGLALPFVLFFIVFAQPGGDAGGEALTLLGEAAVGAAIGVALGIAAGRLHDRLPGGGITAAYEGIYSVGIGIAAFGLAEVTFGNGLIAAFVAGIALGATECEVPDSFMEFAENVSTIAQVLTFFVFGALIVSTGFHSEIWPLLVFIPFAFLVARPLALLLSLVRTGLARPLKLFMAWFGPKGVASMLFALFVLNSRAGERSLIFDVAAFTILASIVAHGLTDTVGGRWIERRMNARDPTTATRVD
ncbi:MAG: sodium:proton antiporter [Solirubrobacterales bacterium]|nr:sodium:proton antiporter [Solirubrobacterales bacterium]